MAWGRAGDGVRAAELAGVTAGAPGHGCCAGPAAAVAAGELCEVLGAAVAEVTRQEARVDVKAGQLAGVAGALSAVAVGAATGVGALAPLAPGVPGWLVVAVVALLAAAGLWAGAVVVLLWRIIRPQLGGARRGSFLRADHVEQLQVMSLAEYRLALVSSLDALVLRRYRAVALAADLLVAGFVPLLAAGAVAGLWLVVA